LTAPAGAAQVTPARKTLLIVYHTHTGGTLQMARAAADGAGREPAINVRLLHAAQAGPDDVLAADGMIFDRSYYAALDRINGRPYACLVCAGSDGSNAVRQIERICTGWRLRLIADALIVCTHAQTPDDILRDKRIDPPDLERCADLGAAFGAGLAMGIY
jgi:hypothetical protein